MAFALKKYAPVWLAVLLPLAALAYNHWAHYGFYVDDAYITMRYAQRFLQGNGLTWNNGEYVEGYSNFLWLMLTIILGFLGLELVLATKILGVACCGFTFAALAYFMRKRFSPMAVFFGLMVFASSASVAIWAMSGLEAALVMALLAGAMMSAEPLLSGQNRPKTIQAGLMLGLLCWARPEGPVFTVFMASGLLLFGRAPLNARLKIAVWICTIPFLFFLAQLAFRLEYYHQWTANSALAKLSFTWLHISGGIGYVQNAIISFLPVIVYCCTNARLTQQPQPFNLLLIWVMVWFALVVAACGGDIFSNGYRFFVPLVPLVALLAAQCAQNGLAWATKCKEMTLLALVLALQLYTQVQYPPHRDTGISGLTEVWAAMGKALKERFVAYQPVVATPAAGAIPYYSELPSIDAFGLNDAYLTEHRYENTHFGNGMVGHELFDPDYLQSRKPDILMFDTPGAPTFCEQIDCHHLMDDYRADALVTPNFTIRIWVRKDSTKLGPPVQAN